MLSSGVPRIRRRPGLSLVEIMLATFILAVVMIPILQLIFGGVKETARGRDQATAVSLATNIMSQLLDKVPYKDFHPDDGPTPLSLSEFHKSEDESPGPFADRKQCRLGDGPDSEYERILDQDREPGDGQRTIFKEGTHFEVILFAGTYKDVPGSGGGSFNVPDLTKELTFSFFKNPFIDMDGQQRSEARKDVVLENQDKTPYKAEGQPAPANVTRVDDPRFRPGWPKAEGFPITDATFYKGGGGTPSSGEDPNGNPDPRWARNTLDLSDFREDDGAMLKLVLGIRWRPGGGTGKAYTRTTKEFWLVSFKAKLEEG